LAVVPSIGRANRVEGADHLEADVTRELYEQYANQIFRYCLHQLGTREEAEDAVQSTFLNAFRGLRRGVVPELESAWLFKIAHNVCLSRRRSSWRRGRIESPADFELVEELTPAPPRRHDELIGLQDVLEEMPESQRRAILLREWQGLSYREIAEELDLTQAAVETLIFRARRALAAGLEEPPPRPRRRFARAADLGNVLAGLKSFLLGGGAAMKIAATAAVVGAASVAVAGPVVHHRQHHSAPAPAPAKPAAHTRHVQPATAPAARVPARTVHQPAVPATKKTTPAALHARKPAQPPGRVKHLARLSGIAAPAPQRSRATTHGPIWKTVPAASHDRVRSAKTDRHAVVPVVKKTSRAAPKAKAKSKSKSKSVRVAKPRPVHPVHPAQPAPPTQSASTAVETRAPAEAGSQDQGQGQANGKGKAGVAP
jgi:RNA polymerase sigma factor (sigma-70 family)